MISVQLLGATQLALVQAAGSETLVVMTRPGGWQHWVGVFADVATIMIAVAMIAIALALIAAAWQSRKIYGKLHGLLDRLRGDIQPILGHATDVAENVNYMSTAIRDDVEQFRATLESAQTRLTDAAGSAEHRIRRFNALLEVVQDEAEELFIETASTLRGVQAGARTLRGDAADEIPWERDDDAGARVVRQPRQPSRDNP